MSAAEPTRRDFLLVATGAVGAIGAAATLVPLISQMNPDASTIAAGVPIEVDLAPIAEGQIIKVFWRGNPIYISHRTKKEIAEAQNVPPGGDRHLHPSGLHSARSPGRLRRLVLPLPWLPIRYVRPYPPGASAR